MKFKVHLIKNKNIKHRNKPSLAKMLNEARINMELYYWGLDSAMSSPAVPVKLIGTGQNSEKLNIENYEVDLYKEACDTVFNVYLSRLKQKIVLSGLAFATILGAIGLSTGWAEAAANQMINPPVSAEKAVESNSPVIPRVDSTKVRLDQVVNGVKSSPVELARFHNNLPNFHTNFHANSVGGSHNNMEWPNSSAGAHVNEAWANNVSISEETHTNFSGGQITSDYLY